ncbi:GNAT family N-acetyltransferase [Pseudoalteromonas atlantica]|uniref:GNAT family N-acetyltransferase n=1 Tax=Pseudoalteromonas atlantica TaxID=288 RepID=UPI0037364828
MQAFWWQGLASEQLQGFIAKIAQIESWKILIASVDNINTASANLLKKHGFLENSVSTNGVVFYQYEFLNRNEKPTTTL